MQLWETAARLQLPVFPCNALKKPTCPHGFKDAQREPSEIKRLFAAYPGKLIGVPTGTASGVDVLDLDTARHKEVILWKASMALPQTRIHQTESGGCHYLFQHAPGLRSWTARPLVGVDGRADGGYMIFWPAAGYAVDLKPIVEWPPQLLKVCEAAKPPPRRLATKIEPISDAKLAGIIRTIGNAPNGTRNNLLFWGACRVAEWINEGTVKRAVGEAVLMAAGRHAGLADVEIARTIASAFTGGRNGNPAE